MLKIRLARIGARQRPFYRVVVMDERSKRSGEYIELLGTYNPLTKPKEIKLKQDRIDHWIKQGAQMSDGFLRIIGKAPQRPARKPKKEKKIPATAATTPAQAIEEKTAEEAQPIAEEVKLEITPEEITPEKTAPVEADVQQSDSQPTAEINEETEKEIKNEGSA